MLTFRRLPDLELPADADRDNVYEITVVAADNGGLRDTVNATIAITDQAEGPVIAGTGSFTVTENYDITQALGSYTATDARDGRRVYPQWSLSGRDGGDFVIDRYSGALAFRNTPDYDRPADSDRDNVYEVTVRGHDSRAYGYLNVTVAVTNINEGAPVVTGRTSHTVRENTTSAIHTYRATDPDLGDTIAWSTGGTDAGDFVITKDSSGRGLLAFASPPDFENPRDVGSDNVYDLEVIATDGAGLRGTLDVTVTVTALNEGPVVSGTATFTINENQDLAGAVYTATDPEAIGGVTTTITWSVTGRGRWRFHHRPRDWRHHLPHPARPRAAGGLQPGQRVRTHRPSLRRQELRDLRRDGDGAPRQRGAGDHRPGQLHLSGKRHFRPIHLPGHRPRGRRLHPGTWAASTPATSASPRTAAAGAS